jgi:hypothetical protein
MRVLLQYVDTGERHCAEPDSASITSRPEAEPQQLRQASKIRFSEIHPFGSPVGFLARAAHHARDALVTRRGFIAKNRGRWHYSDLFQVCWRATRARVLSDFRFYV